MENDLLARAERAIRESQLTRNEARKDRVNARAAVARAHLTVRLARVEGERSVNPCGEEVSQIRNFAGLAGDSVCPETHSDKAG